MIAWNSRGPPGSPSSIYLARTFSERIIFRDLPLGCSSMRIIFCNGSGELGVTGRAFTAVENFDMGWMYSFDD